MKPEHLAAYLSKAVPAAERREIERHLVVCADCRQDLAEAADLGHQRGRNWWVTIGVPAAAAAVLALAVVGPFDRGAEQRSDGPILRGEQNEGIPQFAAVAPADGAEITADSLTFRWRSEGVGVHYLVTLTDQDGDVVWSTGTVDTTIGLPREVGLQPDGRYYWYVDALLEGARSSTTGVLEFVVTP